MGLEVIPVTSTTNKITVINKMFQNTPALSTVPILLLNKSFFSAKVVKSYMSLKILFLLPCWVFSISCLSVLC